MAYGTASITSATPAKDLMAALNPLLTANGFTFVETFQTTAGTTNPSADVYKSPAAGNVFGQDWYLILRRQADTNVNLWVQVAEGYSTGTHKASNFGGTGASTTPTPGTYTNPTAATAPDAFGAYPVSLTTSLYTYWYSITANRVILGIKTTSEMGLYAGLYDDLLPSGVTQFPLVWVTFPTITTNTAGIGGGVASGVMGGFTREPGQTAAGADNFGARLHNGYWKDPSANMTLTVNTAFTPMTSAAALYGNPFTLSRVLLGSQRTVTTQADALRGLLKDCVSSPVPSVAGDTVTASGKTYTRFGGPTSSMGIFVDQAP
jgi:hypothetical protein